MTSPRNLKRRIVTSPRHHKSSPPQKNTKKSYLPQRTCPQGEKESAIGLPHRRASKGVSDGVFWIAHLSREGAAPHHDAQFNSANCCCDRSKSVALLLQQQGVAGARAHRPAHSWQGGQLARLTMPCLPYLFGCCSLSLCVAAPIFASISRGP